MRNAKNALKIKENDPEIKLDGKHQLTTKIFVRILGPVRKDL